MTRTRRLATSALLTALAATCGVVAMPSPARAAAPVTVDDTASLYAGNGVEVDVLANDSDPDGTAELALCRIAPESYKKIRILSDGGSVLFVVAGPRTRPGTYTFTYYACDYETLVPGTLTVTIEPEPEITAVALPNKPGKIKVKNPAGFKIRFLYGSFAEEEPDATVKIARHSSVVLDVRRTRIDWIALTLRGDFLRVGHVRGIELPPGTTPPPAGRPLAPRLQELWRA